MVTIVNYEPREKEGKTFYAITLQGEERIALSEETGNCYLTADKTTITTTFNEAACQMLIGKKLPGSIKRIECNPYLWKNKDTGEEKTIMHKFQYSPEETSAVMTANPPMQLQSVKPFMGMAA